jgi:ribonuclease J
MKEELIFCPLGGSGEIGMNMNLFAYGKPENQKWIIVDIGVTFADDSIPGIDLIYPDPGFIIDKKEDLLGIVLTHAHEDHIGAIAHIWPSLECKIYATPFTSVLISEKFKEKKIDITGYLKIVELNSTLNLDPFKVEFVTLTHSILEPNGLKIETPVGNILHTGDWKCDSDPLIGENINSKKT